MIRYFSRHQRFLLPVLEATFAQLMLLGLFSCILFASHKAGLMKALEHVLKDSAHVIGEKAEDVHFMLFIGCDSCAGPVVALLARYLPALFRCAVS